MEKAKRAKSTLEFKQEAVRLVESGQTLAAAARSLGLVEQTLHNWATPGRVRLAARLAATASPGRPCG
jgi:transposase